MNFLDIVKIYKSEWQEVSKRKLEEAECSSIEKAFVVASKWGKSVCFMIPGKGKAFIPLEPIANVSLGDDIDVRTIELVSLKYIGTNIEHAKESIIRVRIPEEDTVIDANSFDNPFGL